MVSMIGFHLAVALGLVAQATAQRTSTRQAIPLNPWSTTERPSTTDLLVERRDTFSTCGYVDGDGESPVKCWGETCAFLFIYGRGTVYGGCCDTDCTIPTTCIESGTASDGYTLGCTSGFFSRCATYSWPDLTAEKYHCSSFPAIETVSTEVEHVSTQATTSEGDVSAIVPPAETSDPGQDDDDGDKDDDDDDDGGGLGWEHDLSSKQRVGAGIGSGISGGLLLMFFAIFGCCRRPRRGTKQPADRQQPVERKDTQGLTRDGPLTSQTN